MTGTDLTDTDITSTESRTRTAIVTGGSRGIGRAVAARLALDGLAVAIVYAGNHSEAESTLDQLRAAGADPVALHADIADEVALAAAFDAVEQRFGGVDVVVNAAGIMRLEPVADIDLDTLDGLLRTNVRGHFVVAREAARRLRDGGAFIGFSTSVTRLSLPTYGAYAATKGAVEAMVPILAKELAGRDITVDAVAPGPTATALFLDGRSDEAIEQIAGSNPMHRLGTPGDVAEVVAHLAGPARWINGQTVFVNGGAA